MPKRIKLRRFRRGEKKMLFTKVHDRKLPVWIAQRYRVIAGIYQQQSVRATARQLGCAKETAYRCVKEFNQHGFRRFQRCSNPEGRPTQISKRQMTILLRTAQKRPTDVGLPFTNWSINTLQEYLVKRKNFPKVSPEWLRRLLHRGKVSWQHTKTWKQSHDPDFAAKKSVFWRFMRNVRSMAQWFAMISWVHWSSDRSPECVGQAEVNQNGIGLPTPVSKAQNNCMVSLMFMPTVWWAAYANVKPQKISKFALLNCAPATPSKFGSLLSWTTSLPISVLHKISFQGTIWKPSMCLPRLLG